MKFGILLAMGLEFWGQQLYFLNTENCLIFASAQGEDSERMSECGRGTERREGLTPLYRKNG